MTTGIQNRGDTAGLAGLAPVVSEPLDRGVISIGDVLAGIVLPDLAVRMRGQFDLPKVVAFAAGRGDSERP